MAEYNEQNYTNELENKLREAEREIEHLRIALEAERTRFVIASDFTDCGIWEYDIETKVSYQYKKLEGRYCENLDPINNFREAVLGWGLIYNEDIPVFIEYCDSMDRGDPEMKFDMRSYDDDYNQRWIRYEGKTICDNNGKPVKVVGRTLNVSSEHSLDENLERTDEKGFDRLTGLLSKDMAFKNAVKKLTLHSYKYIPVLFIFDIDDFRTINDQWGKIYGDYVLETFAKLITSLVTNDEVAGRIGGDEFMVLKFFEKHEQIEVFFKNVDNRFYGYQFPRGGQFHISAGAAVYDDGMSFEELFRRADVTLYHVKHNMKAECVLYFPEIEVSKVSGETQIKSYSTDEEQGNISVSHLNNNEKKLFDFAFDMFNKCSELDEAISYIFPEIGKFYNLDCINIIQKDLSGKVSATHCWTNQGVCEFNTDYLTFYSGRWSWLEQYYLENQKYILSSATSVSAERRYYMEKYGLKAVVRCPIFDGADLVGFVSYDEYTDDRVWNESEITTFCTLTKMLSAYILKLRNKDKLNNANYYTSAMLDNQKLTSYAIDPDTYEITYTSEYAVDRFPDIAIGKKCYESIMGEKEPCKNCPIKLMADGRDRASVESYNEKYDTWFGYTCTKVYNTDGKQNFLVCINDIASFIERINSKDNLTGLMTFERFNADAGKALCSNHKYAVAVISIHKFRSINEKHGLSIGNLVLTEFAQKVTGSLAEGEYACRWGGGKFLMLIRYDFSDDLENRINMLLKATSADIYSITGVNPNFTAGIFEIRDKGSQLISAIDKANEARKSLVITYNSENRVAVYDEKMAKDSEDRLVIEGMMTEALTNHEFKAYYQPKVRLSDSKIIGAEALVRWIRPDGEIISPGRFVPVFEENGFISEMDFEIYRQVFSRIRKWINDGKEVPVISVNVSRRHFQGNDFPSKIEALRAEFNIPHKYIELEITESMFSSNLDHVIEVVNELRSYGFIISVDDFGTGFSTLNLITMLPVDVLKVDGGFFMNNLLSDKDKAVISAIISLAHKLNLSVVSEGIENEVQVSFLNETGCDSVQGYYFYKPMPLEAFEKLI